MIISRSRVSIKYLCCLSSTTVGRMARDVTFGFWWRKRGWWWLDIGVCLIVLSQFVFVCLCFVFFIWLVVFPHFIFLFEFLYLYIYLWICICVFVVWYFPGSLAAFYIFICIFVNLYLYLPCSLSTVCKEQWRSQSFPHQHCSGPRIIINIVTV